MTGTRIPLLHRRRDSPRDTLFLGICRFSGRKKKKNPCQKDTSASGLGGLITKNLRQQHPVGEAQELPVGQVGQLGQGWELGECTPVGSTNRGGTSCDRHSKWGSPGEEEEMGVRF